MENGSFGVETNLVIPGSPQRESTSPKGVTTLSKRHRKGKIINQGYTTKERQDARREAAKAFLTSIPMDQKKHGPPRRSPNISMVIQPIKQESNATILLPLEPSREEATTNMTPIKMSSSQVIQPRIQHSASTESPIMSTKRRNSASTGKKVSQSNIDLGGMTSQSSYLICKYNIDPESKRLAYMYNGHPIALSTILHYKRPQKSFKPESAIRIRTNSFTAQLDLEGFGLKDTSQEVSLGGLGLLEPIWIQDESTENPSFSPSPTRRTTQRRTPLSLTHQSSFREGLTPPPSTDVMTTAKQYPWQFFRDNHAPQNIIINYHPLCMDNHEYFLGRHVTTLNLPGYRVSLLGYAKESEIKKEINKQFSDTFPHIKISLTKLRSIKRDIIRISQECGLDPVAVAHAHVYFEKLMMMGKVTKSNRKLVAGSCLLLAAKFSSDFKSSDIKILIEEVTDKFRISTKELLSAEFPTLIALEFSLLTPHHQTKIHFDRIREID